MPTRREVRSCTARGHVAHTAALHPSPAKLNRTLGIESCVVSTSNSMTGVINSSVYGRPLANADGSGSDGTGQLMSPDKQIGEVRGGGGGGRD
jgi:hypothetical protein